MINNCKYAKTKDIRIKLSIIIFLIYEIILITLNRYNIYIQKNKHVIIRRKIVINENDDDDDDRYLFRHSNNIIFLRV